MAVTAGVVSALIADGLDEDVAIEVYATVYAFVIGFVSLETRTVDIDHSALEGHPTLRRLSERLADLFDRAAFDRGLTGAGRGGPALINRGARMIEAKSIPHVALAFVVAAGLTLGACRPSHFPRPHSHSSRVGEDRSRPLSGSGPKVGLLAARVARTEGAVRSTRSLRRRPRPMASQFKLFVLGALAERGRRRAHLLGPDPDGRQTP